MASIITIATGSLAYWSAESRTEDSRAFGVKGDFHKPQSCGFAGLSAFAANGNHPPAQLDGAICWDAGIDLLFRIAGAR